MCFADNEKEKMSPPNRATALCYQLHDNLRVGYALARLSNNEFEKALRAIEANIDAFRAMEMLDDEKRKA